jgi:hypothetical protein
VIRFLLALLFLFPSGAWAGITTTGPTMVPPVRGGTGIDTSASTGYLHILTGAWSVIPTIPFTDLSGSLACSQLPALTGSVTTSAGSCATTVITNANLTGDVTSIGNATTLASIPTATPAVGYILFTDIAAPSSPSAGKLAIFGDSTGLRFHDKNAAGTIGTTVVADTGSSNNFLTAISAAGVISKAQPAFTNLSGSATCAQLPALTGSVTTSAGSCATTVITNANLTGPITSSGNATAIAAQTGTGTTFVMQVAPTITTSVTVPIVYGGTTVGSTLTLAGTSNGSPASADVILNGSAQGNVAVGTTTPNVGGFASGTVTSVSGATKGVLELISTSADAPATDLGYVSFIGSANTSGKRMAEVYAQTVGATSNNRGAFLGFNTKPNAGSLTERMRIESGGNVDINTTASNVAAFSASNTYLTIGAASGFESVVEVTGNTASGATGIGSIAFTNISGSKRGARIEAITNGTDGSADLAVYTSSAGTLAEVLRWTKAGATRLAGFTFANIATVLTTNGDVGYCSDCTIANPCAGSGTGAIAKRLNGVSICN